MPNRPILSLPFPEPVNPPRPPRGGSTITQPGRIRQGERLSPKFDALARVISDPQQIIQLSADPASVAPERAVVFEVVGSIVSFYEKAASIGLEYLADDEREFVPDDDFHEEAKPDDEVSGRIYLAMPDVAALRELIRLWRLYLAGTRMAKGFGMWTELFKQLRDVRPWGPQDRVLPETLEYWRERVADAPEAPVRFEVELWYRENSTTRQTRYLALAREIARLGGAIIHHATISEIRYDGVLVDLPAQQIQALLENPNISLALIDDIMFIRPQSIAQFPIDDGLADDVAVTPLAHVDDRQPIAALLDGLPVQNHQRLANRLFVDDPDGFETGYTVSTRRHGTEMASLIIHGDLGSVEPPLSRPLYVRPVLRPTPSGSERTPADKLLVDLIYRSVRRMKEGDGDEAATAPSVILINISLGDQNRPFSGQISPWARLLDYLAFEHRVLFLVSAGNIYSHLPITEFTTWTEFEDATPDRREMAVLNALNENKAYRTLLSPAESLNSLTIGAAHTDGASATHRSTNAIDPFTGSHLPNISSAVGLGHRRIIKPDILLDGGRELVQMSSTNPHLKIQATNPGRFFGLLAAAPDPVGADLARTAYTSGTSAATALATRAGHRIYDILMDRIGGSNHADIPHNSMALLIKALLVHGTAWGDKGELLDGIFAPRGAGAHFERRDDIARLLGYGYLDVARILECTANRATLLGHGTIEPGGASLYRVPIPAGLERVREFRAVTISLAWFSPINARHQGYRMAALEAGPGGDREYSLGVDRVGAQPHNNAIRRGCIFHERRDGEKASVFIDGGDILIRVSCRATAGEFTQPVPYALAVSLEVGINSTIQVYDEVRAEISTRLQQPIPAVQV